MRRVSCGELFSNAFFRAMVGLFFFRAMVGLLRTMDSASTLQTLLHLPPCTRQPVQWLLTDDPQNEVAVCSRLKPCLAAFVGRSNRAFKSTNMGGSTFLTV